MNEKVKQLLQRKVILPEVYAELDRTGGRVKVIFSKTADIPMENMIEYLEKKNITVKPKHTDRFAFAEIDRGDADRIEADHAGKEGRNIIAHAWMNKRMEKYVATSGRTINAVAARSLFDVNGSGVHWAVLDTGIDSSHSLLNGRVVQRKDFTDSDNINSISGIWSDPHGTHVAGIIAQIAPGVSLHDFKVLGPDGGTADGIIRAMYEIRRMNFESPDEMKIHGVNMSLGGQVSVGSYGCGWSPECQEANRLMESGVVVCVAAGNDGYKEFATLPNGELEVYASFTNNSLGDPAVAEQVITVGSTHKEYPHRYGPSYFSSKGPTGDGRFKPDLLAPGEKILSAEAGTENGMVEMDGTSMAAPHVSGAIALYLSARPEWKGRALDVKRILLDSCTDLGRDRNFQGVGLVNPLRMIESV